MKKKRSSKRKQAAHGKSRAQNLKSSNSNDKHLNQNILAIVLISFGLFLGLSVKFTASSQGLISFAVLMFLMKKLFSSQEIEESTGSKESCSSLENLATMGSESIDSLDIIETKSVDDDDLDDKDARTEDDEDIGFSLQSETFHTGSPPHPDLDPSPHPDLDPSPHLDLCTSPEPSLPPPPPIPPPLPPSLLSTPIPPPLPPLHPVNPTLHAPSSASQEPLLKSSPLSKIPVFKLGKTFWMDSSDAINPVSTETFFANLSLSLNSNSSRTRNLSHSIITMERSMSSASSIGSRKNTTAISCIDPKKAQGLGILLKTIKLSAHTLQIILHDPEKIHDPNANIPLHVIPELCKYLPSNDDLESLRKADIQELAAPDLFLLELSEIPLVDIKLSAMALYLQLSDGDRFDRLARDFDLASKILALFQNSWRLKLLLKVSEF